MAKKKAVVKKKVAKKKDGDKNGIAAPAISFLLGVVVGRHGVPAVTHGVYIGLIVASIAFNWGGGW